jgi:hypothetical protein
MLDNQIRKQVDKKIIKINKNYSAHTLEANQRVHMSLSHYDVFFIVDVLPYIHIYIPSG